MRDHDPMKGFERTLQPTTDGVLLKLHVFPHAKHPCFPAGYNTWRQCIDIKVSAEAQGNKANQAVIRDVARYFSLSPGDIVIVAGMNTREKTLLLKHISRETVWKKLEESLHGL